MPKLPAPVFRLFVTALLLLASAAALAAQPAPEAPAGAGATSAPATAGKSFVLRLPAGRKHLVTVPEALSPPLQVTSDQVTLTAPAGVPKFTVLIVDEESGYAARRSFESKKLPAETRIAPGDFNLVHVVKVRVTGKEGKPVANAMVSLVDPAGKRRQQVVTPTHRGELILEDVQEGQTKVEVIPAGGTLTTKTVPIGLAKGETVQTVEVALPEVSAVVDTPAGTTAGTGSGGAPPSPGGAPATTAPAPAPPPERENPASQAFSTILGFAILAGIGFGIYVMGKKQGWTIEGTMQKLGVTPQTQVDAGPSSDGAPSPPPPPPPVVSDPNRCQFCGEIKDPATGACACTVDRSAGVPAPAWQPTATSGSGPRLIATAGAYMGEIFPLSGDVLIGRDQSNQVSLERDTTASRRHARLVPDGDGYRVVDEGSSNGTFVNGAKVSEIRLQPGDEVTIGATRFRFEA